MSRLWLVDLRFCRFEIEITVQHSTNKSRAQRMFSSEAPHPFPCGFSVRGRETSKNLSALFWFVFHWRQPVGIFEMFAQETCDPCPLTSKPSSFQCGAKRGIYGAERSESIRVAASFRGILESLRWQLSGKFSSKSPGGWEWQKHAFCKQKI